MVEVVDPKDKSLSLERRFKKRELKPGCARDRCPAYDVLLAIGRIDGNAIGGGIHHRPDNGSVATIEDLNSRSIVRRIVVSANGFQASHS
jgi:hypothetical protein